MICKHFNLSYIDLRDDISLVDYLVMLAEAVEAEASTQYDLGIVSATAFHSPKRLKAIRRQLERLRNVSVGGQNNIAQNLVGFVTEQMKGKVQVNGDAEDYAKATGKNVAYRDENGNLFDKDGNPKVPDSLTFIVNMRKIQH